MSAAGGGCPLQLVTDVRADCSVKQPLYNQLFEYANKNLAGQICGIMNADIYLERGWTELRREHFHNGRVSRPAGASTESG